MLEYEEGETRQVQDIRNRYMLHLQRVHVTPERVMFVHVAQAELAAKGPDRDSAAHHSTRLPHSVFGHRVRRRAHTNATDNMAQQLDRRTKELAFL